MTCERCREQISGALDGALTEEETDALYEHLALCPECRDYCADLAVVTAAMEREPIHAPKALKRRVMSAVSGEKQEKKKKTIPFPARSALTAAACLALVLVGVLGVGSRETEAPDIPPVEPAARTASFSVEDETPPEFTIQVTEYRAGTLTGESGGSTVTVVIPEGTELPEGGIAEGDRVTVTLDPDTGMALLIEKCP